MALYYNGIVLMNSCLDTDLYIDCVGSLSYNASINVYGCFPIYFLTYLTKPK